MVAPALECWFQSRSLLLLWPSYSEQKITTFALDGTKVVKTRNLKIEFVAMVCSSKFEHSSTPYLRHFAIGFYGVVERYMHCTVRGNVVILGDIELY